MRWNVKVKSQQCEIGIQKEMREEITVGMISLHPDLTSPSPQQPVLLQYLSLREFNLCRNPTWEYPPAEQYRKHDGQVKEHELVVQLTLVPTACSATVSVASTSQSCTFDCTRPSDWWSTKYNDQIKEHNEFYKPKFMALSGVSI